jgi:nucleotidyltransferase/DNA polymerase involved in DNA repair
MYSPGAPRLIAHLDMDAFYASVELLRYPELRGLPVVIGGGQRHQPVLQPDGTRRFATLCEYTGRGVVTTSTYEARALGVFSAMGTMKAAQLAPDAVLLPVDFDEYRKYSRLFKAAVREIAPCVEDRGIDEIYIDLSELPGVHGDGGHAIGMRLKQAVKAATGLSCSIGITPNKLLSKLGSELDKPDGLTLLGLADIPARIWPLAARKVNGIGPKASEKLAGLGLHTVGDIAAADPELLVQHFGPHYGRWLHEASHGRDDREVVTRSDGFAVRDHLRARPARGARPGHAVGHLHRAVRRSGRRPVAQGLREQDDRHQAALRRLQVGHARSHAASPHAGRAHHPPRSRRVPQARRPLAPLAPARRACRRAGQADRSAGPRRDRAAAAGPASCRRTGRGLRPAAVRSARFGLSGQLPHRHRP